MWTLTFVLASDPVDYDVIRNVLQNFIQALSLIKNGHRPSHYVTLALQSFLGEELPLKVAERLVTRQGELQQNAGEIILMLHPGNAMTTAWTDHQVHGSGH